MPRHRFSSSPREEEPAGEWPWRAPGSSESGFECSSHPILASSLWRLAALHGFWSIGVLPAWPQVFVQVQAE